MLKWADSFIDNIWFLSLSPLSLSLSLSLESCSILKDEGQKQLFANLNLDSLKHVAWREKVVVPFKKSVSVVTLFSKIVYIFWSSILYGDSLC